MSPPSGTKIKGYLEQGKEFEPEQRTKFLEENPGIAEILNEQDPEKSIKLAEDYGIRDIVVNGKPRQIKTKSGIQSIQNLYDSGRNPGLRVLLQNVIGKKTFQQNEELTSTFRQLFPSPDSELGDILKGDKRKVVELDFLKFTEGKSVSNPPGSDSSNLSTTLASTAGLKNELVVDVDDNQAIGKEASGVKNVLEAAEAQAQVKLESQQGLDALDSTPIEEGEVNPDIKTEIDVQEVKIRTTLEASEGLLRPIQIADPQATSVEAPIQAGEALLTPKESSDLLTEVDQLIAGMSSITLPPVEQELPGTSTLVPIDLTTEGTSVLPIDLTGITPIEFEGESESVQTGAEQAQAPSGILQGQESKVQVKHDPIHSDALSIFFGSANEPRWDPTLLVGRPEMTKEMLLKQTEKIVDKFGVDILVFEMKSGESSEFEFIKRENEEILQLYTRLQGIGHEIVGFESESESGSGSGPTGDGDGDVSMKVSDLVNFASLLSDDIQVPLDSTQESTPLNPEAGSSSRVEPQSVQAEVQTKPFVYQNTSGIRLNKTMTDREARRGYQESLASHMTRGGSKPLKLRRNMTVGFNHAGIKARPEVMDGLRNSVLGTSRICPEGYAKTGAPLRPTEQNFRANVRI